MKSAEIGGIGMPGWWAVAPVGGRRFLGGLARMMRSAKRSKSPDVTQAAVKWERALGWSIKVLLITEKQKAESRKQKLGRLSWSSSRSGSPRVDAELVEG